MNIRRTAETWIGIGVVGAAGVLAATLAGAGLIPGGGPSKSDCYSELSVQGVEASSASVRNNKKISCTDGDPCDAGPCGDNSCTFKVDVCWNQAGVGGCTPPTSLDSIKLAKLAATIPADLSGDSCTGAFTDLVVATKKNGKKPGKANVHVVAKAPKGTKPRTDADNYQFICVPRPSTQPCSPSGAFMD